MQTNRGSQVVHNNIPFNYIYIYIIYHRGTASTILCPLIYNIYFLSTIFIFIIIIPYFLSGGGVGGSWNDGEGR